MAVLAVVSGVVVLGGFLVAAHALYTRASRVLDRLTSPPPAPRGRRN